MFYIFYICLIKRMFASKFVTQEIKFDCEDVKKDIARLNSEYEGVMKALRLIKSSRSDSNEQLKRMGKLSLVFQSDADVTMSLRMRAKEVLNEINQSKLTLASIGCTTNPCIQKGFTFVNGTCAMTLNRNLEDLSGPERSMGRCSCSKLDRRGRVHQGSKRETFYENEICVIF